MGLIDFFQTHNVEHFVRRSRERLAAGKIDEANRLVDKGLAKFPGARSLREIQLAVRRTQAREAMGDLKSRITEDSDPVAFEQLIALYREIEMPAEALRAASQYAEAHPMSDTPHMLLGDMYLARFYDDISARDGLAASRHLQRASQLNAEAIKPVMLLAELYYCIDAPRRLYGVARTLKSMAGDDPVVRKVLKTIVPHCDSSEAPRLDSHFERIEVAGEFPRDPLSWPLATPRNRDAILQEERANRAARTLVSKKAVEEVAILRRNGTVISHYGSMERPEQSDADQAEGETEHEPAIVSVSRHVARTVSKHAREFDLGAFKRCTIQGPHGHVIVGRIGNVIAGTRARTSVEPGRVWERVRIRLESALKGAEA